MLHMVKTVYSLVTSSNNLVKTSFLALFLFAALGLSWHGEKNWPKYIELGVAHVKKFVIKSIFPSFPSSSDTNTPGFCSIVCRALAK